MGDEIMGNEKMQHTPGPWSLARDGRTIYGPPDAEGRSELVASVSTAHEFFNGPDQPEKSANAHLISAAPDFFEAVSEYLEWGPMSNSDRYIFETKFRAAVAKATHAATDEAR